MKENGARYLLRYSADQKKNTLEHHINAGKNGLIISTQLSVMRNGLLKRTAICSNMQIFMGPGGLKYPRQ